MITQLIINGVISGSLYALLACALALSIQITGAYNFALGHLVVLSSYLLIAFQNLFELSLINSFFLLLFTTPLFALGMRNIIFAPFERHGAFCIMIASLVCSSLIEAGLLLVYGSDYQRPLQSEFWSTSFASFAGFSKLDLLLVLAALFSIVAARWFLQVSKFGRKFRALCDNRLAAAAAGININAIGFGGYLICAIWLCIASVATVYQLNTNTQLGFTLTLKALAIVTCFGVMNFSQITLAALTLGIMENLLNLVNAVIPISYKDSLAVVLMIAVLLYRGSIADKTRVV